MRLGVVCLVLSTVLWSFSSIFMKYFSNQRLDSDVQNLFRYAFAAVGLWAFVLPLFRREAAVALTRWRSFLPATVLNCVFQVAAVSSLYRRSIFPGLTSLLTKSSVVFACILAFVLYREERQTMLTRRYLAGCALAVAGVAGVVCFKQQATFDFTGGVLLIFLASLCWAGYTLCMKSAVRQTRPVIAFTVVSTFTTLFFVALAFGRSRPGQFLDLGTRDQALLALSGLACISAAHSFYFRAVERLGVAVCASFTLVQPLITGMVSAGLFDERLNPGQMVMGATLLAGSYLIISAGRRGPIPPDPEPPDAVGS